MIQDRYEANKPLYIVGMLSMIAGMTLSMFSIYIFPYLIFNLKYSIPEFIFAFEYRLQEIQGWSEFESDWFIFSLFFVGGSFLLWISHFISNWIEEELQSDEIIEKMTEVRKQARHSWFVFFQVGGAVLLIVLLFASINWLVG